MAEQIISASGAQYGVAVDKTNRMFVVGSITDMPTISVSTGSESYVKGGSVAIYTSGLEIIPGSIISMPSVSVTAGSESYIKGGSVEVYTGSIYVTNFAAGTGYAGSDTWIANTVEVSGDIFINGDLTGSVVISSAPLVGVSGAIFDSGDITGSVVISQATRLGVSGAVTVTNRVAGSIVNMPTAPVSGTIFENLVGSVAIASSTLIGISGAIFDSGDITGSVVISQSTKLGISGIIAGSVAQITNPWIIADAGAPDAGLNLETQLVYGASGTAGGMTGSSIGSIIKFSSTGSYIQVFTYQSGLVINIGSWV